jgi:hypothetical protein
MILEGREYGPQELIGTKEIRKKRGIKWDR